MHCVRRVGTVFLTLLVAARMVALASEVEEQAPKAAIDLKAGRHGRPVLVPVRVAGKPVPFLLDTGAAISILDDRLRPAGSNKLQERTLRTAAGDIRVTSYAPPQIEFGDLSLAAVREIVYLDLEPVRQAMGADLMGVLGMDFLRAYAVQLDPDEGRLQVWRSAPRSWSQLPRIALVERSGLVGFESPMHGGATEFFFLDTGATTTSIRGRVFDDLENDHRIRPGKGGEAQTASGTVRSIAGYVSEIVVGQYQLREVRCDRGSTSSIGLRDLSRFIVRMDVASGSLYLTPGKGYGLPERTATVGMSVKFLEHQVIVRSVVPGGPTAMAGVKQGDRLLSINSRPIQEYDLEGLADELTRTPGRSFELLILRDGKEFHAKVTAQSRLSE